uniref:Uncharacterized protein n=1 Tax=viral metagenome TaxID=1070528 RepID=A0A6C0I3C3_9ZZZZ
MPRLVFHVRQHNKWSIFVQYYNNMFHIFGMRDFNKNTVFHTSFIGEHSTYLYLDEILDFKKNRTDYSVTLFYSDLLLFEDGSSFSQFETHANDRMREIIGYDYIQLNEFKVIKYLEFLRSELRIEEYK